MHHTGCVRVRQAHATSTRHVRTPVLPNTKPQILGSIFGSLIYTGLIPGLHLLQKEFQGGIAPGCFGPAPGVTNAMVRGGGVGRVIQLSCLGRQPLACCACPVPLLAAAGCPSMLHNLPSLTPTLSNRPHPLCLRSLAGSFGCEGLSAVRGRSVEVPLVCMHQKVWAR